MKTGNTEHVKTSFGASNDTRASRQSARHLRQLVCRRLTIEELDDLDQNHRLYVKSQDDAILKRFRR